MDPTQLFKATTKANFCLQRHSVITKKGPHPYVIIGLVNSGPERKRILIGNYVFKGKIPISDNDDPVGTAESIFNELEFIDPKNPPKINSFYGAGNIYAADDNSEDCIIIAIGGVYYPQANIMFGVLWDILNQNHILKV
jgi:hypothetical protein